jgi:peptide methionine sulfoxide reductase MsrA
MFLVWRGSIQKSQGCQICSAWLFWRNSGSPSYEVVCGGKTGHAESIQIEFDPKVISSEKILDILWHTHNPTTLNGQGNDLVHSTDQQSFSIINTKGECRVPCKKSSKRQVAVMEIKV